MSILKTVPISVHCPLSDPVEPLTNATLLLFPYIDFTNWVSFESDHPAIRLRTLSEVWQCPRCATVAMQPEANVWVCRECGRRVRVGRDGVIERG